MGFLLVGLMLLVHLRWQTLGVRCGLSRLDRTQRQPDTAMNGDIGQRRDSSGQVIGATDDLEVLFRHAEVW